jgi:DNA mismatch repair protein MutL
MENTNKIRILPEFIANQIAAGEVVQRPESVVKELVENSLDAGADTIVVIVRNSGKQLIHIVDNGSGMNRQDLELATKRHATSKIYSQEDLEQILSYGFRGEALASICSVAQLEIRTRTEGENSGWKLLAEPQKEVVIEPVNTTVGTQIFVRNLFYNIPARRKFLKSDLTEFRYIADTMTKFALSRNDVRFTFYNDDSLVFDVQPAHLLGRIGAVLGTNYAENMLDVDYTFGHVEIKGYIGKPELAKRSATCQHLFLNGRTIKSKQLNFAVFSGYEQLLEKKDSPAFVLNILIDPKLVDVNVHPQKQEVKFEDERSVFNALNKAVAATLQRYNPTMPFRSVENTNENENKQNTEGYLIVNRNTGEIIEQKPFNRLGASWRPPQKPNNYTSGFDIDIFKPVNTPLASQYEQSSYPKQNQTDHDIENDFRNIFAQRNFFQLKNKYIILKTSDKLFVIDQHAAHERILFERASRAMDKAFAYSQTLLFPVKVELNSSEAALVQEIDEELKLLGFDLKSAGNYEFVINAVPKDVTSGAEADALKDILDFYSENDKIKAGGDKRTHLAASFACKAAIKAGEPLSDEEIMRLFEDLFKCEMPHSCPHGRPTIIELTIDEFDKRFERK